MVGRRKLSQTLWIFSAYCCCLFEGITELLLDMYATDQQIFGFWSLIGASMFGVFSLIHDMLRWVPNRAMIVFNAVRNGLKT